MNLKDTFVIFILLFVTTLPHVIVAESNLDAEKQEYQSQITALTEENITLRNNYDSLLESMETMQNELDQYLALIENQNTNVSHLSESVYDLQRQNLELIESLEEEGLHVKMYNLTEEEFDLLCRCVQAEAGYNNFQSQIYVMNVILNRVESDQFPDTITEVINQHRGNRYQFTVVKNGMIETEAEEETINNLKDALLYGKMDLPLNILYFHATGTESNCTPYLECEGTTFGYR